MADSTEGHILQSKITVLSESDLNKLLDKLGLNDVSKLPKVKSTDPSVEALKLPLGAVIKYSRTTGDYYRVVVE